MLRLLSTHACRNCPQNAALFEAADKVGEAVSLEPVLGDTPETHKAAELGLGLPVLVRSDGAMSQDAEKWLGAPKKAPRSVKESVEA